MTPPPNLLLVSYFYPPAATGVRRVLSLVRHLPEHGWYPLVLACKPVRGAGHDPGPLGDPAIASVPVVRTGSLDPYRLMEVLRPSRGGGGAAPQAGKSSGPGRAAMEFLRAHLMLPDDRMGWIPLAAREGVRLVRRHRLRAIYSSNYPQSAHLVAMWISSRTGVPWLADFRDGWTQNPAFRAGNPLLGALQQGLESAVADRADRIVTVSPPITRHLQALRPAERTPVETVYNGFEPEEWTAPLPESGPLEPGRLTLLYAGTFFGRRRPDLFLAALRRVIRMRPAWRQRLRVRMRTAMGQRELRLIKQWGLEDVVHVLPPVSHRDIVAEQRRAEAYLLVLERGPGAEIMVSQKVFEYLAGGRPVFAIVPPGAAAELLAETGGATLAAESQPRTVARRLARFLEEVDTGRHPLPDPRQLRRFERPRQMARLAEILSEMTSRR